eukprot:62960_1
MATDTYHPGIHCESRSTKRTASIVLSSKQISLSNLANLDKKKRRRNKETLELRQTAESVTEGDDEKDLDEYDYESYHDDIEDNHEDYADDPDDDTFSISSQQSFFFHPKNYYGRFKPTNHPKFDAKSVRSVQSVAATVDEMELLPNMDELTNYDKHKPLGTGTDAHVYEVVDRRDKSHVAMKLTKRKSGRYRTEIHLLHQLRTCPYIVKLLKVLEDSSVFVLILEQAPMTLETLLHERCTDAPMQEVVAKDIMGNLLKGIRAIHNLGFVHKDIKPENVLIFADRVHRKLHAKIADFGFATRAQPPIEIISNKQIPKEILKEFVERVGDKCGTPGFWAPELCSNLVVLSNAFKMDVFSAGVTLYRMICNEMPFGLFEAWDVKEHGKLAKMKPNFQIISWIKIKSQTKHQQKHQIEYIRKVSNIHLSKQLLDLLRGMLRIRPKKRLTVT